MNSKRRVFIPATAIAAVAISGLLAISSAKASYEAKHYVITDWTPACPGNDLSQWDDMTRAWYDEITAVGHSFFGFCIGGHCDEAYSRDGQFVDGSIRNSQFADRSVVPWGRDHLHADEGDAVMIGLHGFENGDDYGGRVRVDEAGAGNCNAMRSEMDIGDSDMEFLHISSCQSMDDNQWDNWWRAFGRQHQVDGFHGFMWIGSGLVNDYTRFAREGFQSTIADSWLDNMYRPNISGDNDQCPVAYGVGANGQDMWDRIGTERYDNVLSDPSSVGYWGAIYVTGCDPMAEDVIASNFNN